MTSSRIRISKVYNAPWFAGITLLVALSAAHVFFGFSGRERIDVNIRDGVLLAMVSLLAAWLVFGTVGLGYRIALSATALEILLTSSYAEYGKQMPYVYFHIHIVGAISFAAVAAELAVLRHWFSFRVTGRTGQCGTRARTSTCSIAFMLVCTACVALVLVIDRRYWPASLPAPTHFRYLWPAAYTPVGLSMILAPTCLLLGMAGSSWKRLAAPLLAGTALLFLWHIIPTVALSGRLADSYRAIYSVPYAIIGSWSLTSVLAFQWLYLNGCRLERNRIGTVQPISSLGEKLPAGA